MAYADVDKLSRKLRYIFSTYGVSGVISEKVNKALNDTTADVAEVKHGEWIEANGIRKSKCSNCGTEYERVMEGYHCPTCRAKMDGGKADGKEES